MAGHRYTAEDLLRLRGSPLVQKPDSLPSIDQWLDQPQDQNQRKPRTQSGRADEPAPMGNFSSQRPSLAQTRQLLRTSTDDVVLGPPKTSFASSRTLAKLSEANDKAASPASGDDAPADDATASRARFFRDRDADSTLGRKGFGMKERDTWNTGRGGRNAEDEGRAGEKERYVGRYQRERGDKAGDNDEDTAARRNGYAQKQDSRWTGKPPGQERGGWRDREKRSDREWERGPQAEKEPEWMDEPVVNEEEQAHSVAEFEQWKARRKAADQPAGQKENVEAVPQEAAPAVATKAPGLGFDSSFFGSWAEKKPAEAVPEALPGPTHAAPGKSKSSRFASMFAPKEEPHQALEAASPSQLAFVPNGSSEDKEGFQRMLSMLRSTSMGSQGGPPLPTLTHMPMPMPMPLEREPAELSQSPRREKTASKDLGMPQPGFGPDSFFGQPVPKERQERHSSRFFGGGGPSSVNSPQPAPAPTVIAVVDHPPRNTATPEVQNIQSLLAGQRPPKSAGLNKDSEFLLNLIQAKNASRPPSQATRPEHDNFQLFLDQPTLGQSQRVEKHKAGPPPSFPEDQFFQQRDQPPQGMEPNQNRRSMARAPPGFFDDPSIMHQSQRNYPNEQGPGPQARRQSTHFPTPGPGQYPTDLPFIPAHYGQPPPPQQHHHQHQAQHVDRALPPPPPGFNPNMRHHPQGFANNNNNNIIIPNAFQQSSAGQTISPPMMHPHQQQQHQQQPRQGPDVPGPGQAIQPPPQFGMPPPPPPPGFFNGPPPGFPLMHGNGGDPRLMRNAPEQAMTPMGAAPGNIRLGYDAFAGGLGPRR